MNMKLAGSVFIDRHFHALTHRNYRYMWLGQCVSLIGTWMQNIGQSWLVLTLTGSPLETWDCCGMSVSSDSFIFLVCRHYRG